jgi:biotin carboxylase
MQSHVWGRSVGVEAVLHRGVVARAFVLDDQYTEGVVSPIGHSLPSTLPADEQAQVVADIARFSRALGLTDGPVNFDLRREEGRTVLIECNARLGGSSITDLVRECHGIDLSAVALEIALGRPPASLDAGTEARPVAARLVALRGRGRLKTDMDRITALGAAPHVARLSLTTPPGETVTMIVDRWSLIGAVLTTGDTVEEALERAAEVAAEVAAVSSLEA